MAVNGPKVLAPFLFHPACYKKENIRSCNIYSYELVSKTLAGLPGFQSGFEGRKWKHIGVVVKLFLAVYILH